ncbi:hypothetical protein V7R84_07530 [Arachnia propionica]|uniref:hypothetical protein n=1 Tax=Arachnia propionica TaxID=1750 RepID=UPI0030CF8E29
MDDMLLGAPGSSGGAVFRPRDPSPGTGITAAIINSGIVKGLQSRDLTITSVALGLSVLLDSFDVTRTPGRWTVVLSIPLPPAL